MNCQCGKEITSSVTGNLCTSCFFRKGKVLETPRVEHKTAEFKEDCNLERGKENVKSGIERIRPIISGTGEQDRPTDTRQQDSRGNDKSPEIHNRGNGALDSITSKVE